MIDTGPINSLFEDTRATNNIRAYRKSVGSTNFAKYMYNWWKSALVVLCYYPNGLTAGQLHDNVKAFLEMDHKIWTNSGLLISAIDGVSPNYIRREYAQSLPAIVSATRLRYRAPSATEVHAVMGRPTKYVFYFKDTFEARNILLTNFPDLLPAFVEMDRIAKQSST